MDTLDDLNQCVRNCTDCSLHQGRTNAVPGEGPADAELLFIGEGPGFHEDRQGRPFVGPAGRFLEDLLQSIGMTRDQVYIANMVKCRPPNNRDPAPNEIAECSKYLDRQIELIDPLLIVTLGRFSMSRFLPGRSISRARGRLVSVDDRHIFPIMHPAAGLRRQEMRAAIEEDFAKVPGLLDVLRMRVEPASPGAIAETAASYPATSANDPEPRLRLQNQAATRSLWDTPTSPPPETADEPLPDVPGETQADIDPAAGALIPDDPPETNQPPPGQQRLF